jgi:predicted ATP-grasp superfamily ATP-dependent carboligase
VRVFVYEYLSSRAAPNVAGSSLQSEGWAMLSAVLEDFGRCPGVETITLLDPRIAQSGAEEHAFRELAVSADFSLVIAPEFDDLLAQRCRWVEEAGGRLLGPTSAAVELTADKVTLARHWMANGIPTPKLLEFPFPQFPTSFSYPLVCKPRYGAGSQATFLVHDDEDLALALLQAESDGWSSELILQPYVPGLAVSVSFLSGPNQYFSLPAVEQHLSTDGRFRYHGGRLPLPDDLDRRARILAEKGVFSVNGLQGYFGVDLVLGEATDGRGDAVIEINPRLTTSYVGLRRLARFNLAEALLATATGSRMPDCMWRSETIRFHADGRVDDV